jgi:hypothetical protein
MLILYPKNAWKVLKFGNNLYQVGTSFSWSSGNRVIFLDCRVAQQSVVDALLNAYLAKYPAHCKQALGCSGAVLGNSGCHHRKIAIRPQPDSE